MAAKEKKRLRTSITKKNSVISPEKSEHARPYKKKTQEREELSKEKRTKQSHCVK